MGFNLEKKFIIETEKQLNYVFSDSYAKKMTNNNGGELTIENEGWFLFPIFDNSDKKRLKRTFNDIIRETKFFHSQYEGFNEYITFAYNGSGDYLLFNKNIKKEIFIFFHESEEIKKIANDFNELL